MLIMCLGTAAISLLFSGVFIRVAPRLGLIDAPNARSMHTRDTPKGGGVAILLALLVSLLWLWDLNSTQIGPWISMLLVALLLALVGFIDDRIGLSVKLRLPIYALACLYISYTLISSPWLVILVTIYLLWSLNSFNFMDGIDGLAAQQTICVCLGVVVILMGMGLGDVEVPAVELALVLASAAAGFLVLNWPKAHLFMGDSGSIPLGFLLAALSIELALEQGLNLYSWLILMGVFTVDSSLTLIWRMLARQNIAQAHSHHAYQRLARYWASHSKVLILTILINTLWLLPFAWWTALNPQYGPFALVLAYFPLVLGCLKAYKLP